jgi:peptidoglycan/xylan/chitin deacetylase (PgdA/CDA1 family)
MSNKERIHTRNIARAAFFSASFLLAACQGKSEPVVDTIFPNESPTTEVTKCPTITNTPEPTVTATPEPTPTEVINSIEQIPYNPEQKILVLEHHNPSYGVYGDEHGPAYMTAENFEEQLKAMREMDFYTPSEEDLLGWLDGKHGLPEKSVIIRIDIGVPRKDYELGFQLLEKYNFNAILFILTDMIPDTESEAWIGWDTLEKYVKRETIIPGSHGTFHPNYSNISKTNAVWDAVNSKEIIEEKLGREIHFFAYPYDAVGHDDALLNNFKMIFARFNTAYAHAGNPRVGTFYPYIRGETFDWEKFSNYLMSVGEESNK